MNTPDQDKSSRPSPRFNNADALEARLRSDARASRVSAPSGLDLAIAAAVRRDAATVGGRSPARRGRRWFSPAFASFATCACAVAAVVLWNNRNVERDDHTEEIQFLVHAVQTLPAKISSAELPVARQLMAADPLAREITSVRHDARSVLDFLAANFVPSDVLAEDSSALAPQET